MNEAILRSHWVPALVALVQDIGKENVYVSVLESGSWDDSKGALTELETQLTALNIPHQILLENTTHEDEINAEPGPEGWIRTPQGKTELRRIPYLARLRNRVMQPFYNMSRQQSRKFDKILWLNDVVFSTRDIATLLDTNNGQYAAACGLDSPSPGKSTTRSPSATLKEESRSLLRGRFSAQRSLERRSKLDVLFPSLHAGMEL
jgi:hypothetical protein